MTSAVRTFTLVLACLTVCSSNAGAQTPEELTVRRITLDRAEAARNAGRHDEALLLAERAGAIQMTPSVRFFIAREHATLRHFAESLFHAQLCVREAGEGTVANREELLARCRELAQQAQGEVASLVLVLPDPQPTGLEVRVGEQVVRGSRLALPVVVNPGSIVVQATAEGHQPFERTVTVEAGANFPLRISMERAVVRPPPARAVSPSGGPSIGAGPIVVMATGGALLVGSLVTWILRGQAVTGCVEETGSLPNGTRGTAWVCETPTQLDAARSGVPVLEPTSAALLGVGSAAVVGGGVWLLVRALQRPANEEVDREAFRVVPTTQGVAVTGRWSL